MSQEQNNKNCPPVFYSNEVGISVSVNDIQLTFINNYINLNNEKIKNDSLCITLSPVQAKQFSNLLKQMVESYENKFGQLPSPPLLW